MSRAREMLIAGMTARGVSNTWLASKLGYENCPNMVTHFRKGKSKIPPAKIPTIADALHLDRAQFCETVLRERDPGLWEAIEVCLLNEPTQA